VIKWAKLLCILPVGGTCQYCWSVPSIDKCVSARTYFRMCFSGLYSKPKAGISNRSQTFDWHEISSRPIIIQEGIYNDVPRGNVSTSLNDAGKDRYHTGTSSKGILTSFNFPFSKKCDVIASACGSAKLKNVCKQC